LYELGVDIASSGTFFDGDLVLKEYQDNIVQAVVNRLNTYTDELDIFYESYGSILQSYFGWRARPDTLAMMKVEIDAALSEEPRLLAWETELSYQGDGRLRIDMTLYPSLEESVEANLILNGSGLLEVVETEEE